MNYIRGVVIACYLLLAAAAGPAQAGTSAAEVLAFADQLFGQKDYYRAITEYKRYLFLEPRGEDAVTAEFQIGMSYLNGDKLETAIEVFSELADRHINEVIGRKALLMTAEAYSGLKKYREAQDSLEKSLAIYPEHPDNDAVRVLIGWCLLRQGETASAREAFSRCGIDSPLRSQAERMIGETSGYDRLPLKSPLLAGSLSAVLPGAGQLYVGRPRDGMLAFLINGTLILAAVEAFDKDQNFAGSVFVLLDVSWYAGNIYNAVNGAHKVNRSRKQDFLDEVEVKCGIMSSSDPRDGLSPTLAFRTRF